MPFTVGGEWVPSPQESASPSGPIKVRKEKRRQGEITLISHLPLDRQSLKSLVSELQKKLGCGGSLKDGVVVIQGDKVDQIRCFLVAKGFKNVR